VLLEARRPAEAETVYRDDLQRFRENGWSLFGLAQSLRAQQRLDEAADAQRRFERAWTRADIKLTSSRIMDDDRAGSRATRIERHEGHVDIAGRVRLNYVESGDPRGTPVVLLHGYTDSWRSFERVLPNLPSSLRVFAVTMRGHGGSGKPVSGYAPTDFAADVAAFLDAVGVDSAVIVGHSMGSTVAQRFAIDYPTRTRALMLVGAFLPRATNEAVREFWHSSVSTFSDPVDIKAVREFQQSTLAKPVPPDFFDTVVGESMKVPAHVWKAALEPYLTIDFAGRLAEISVPTLLVWGDRDSFTLRSEQDALSGAIAGSRLVVYADTGHSPHWEDPGRFAEQLAAFVSSL
jgi:pimeloyl-ACP methyl ester carboxylesterase